MTAGVYAIKATEAGYTYNLMSAYIGFGEVTITENGEEVKYDYPSLVDAPITAKKTPIKVEKEAVDTDNVVATGNIRYLQSKDKRSIYCTNRYR